MTIRAPNAQCGTISDQGVVLPHPLPLTSERLERHGLFLIEDGQNIFLWVGRDAVNQLVLDVFDLPSYADLRSGKVSARVGPSREPRKLTRHKRLQGTLPVLDNAFSQRVNAIIGKVREARRGPYYPHLYIVKEDGDPALRQWALSLLIEDRMETLPSYQQFVNKLKDSVRSHSLRSLRSIRAKDLTGLNARRSTTSRSRFSFLGLLFCLAFCIPLLLRKKPFASLVVLQ